MSLGGSRRRRRVFGLGLGASKLLSGVRVRWSKTLSGCGAVLVDESAADGVSFDPLAWTDRHDIAGVVRGALVDPAVGSVGVVVLDVFDEQRSEVSLVPDDGPVEELMSQRRDRSFSERVRSG